MNKHLLLSILPNTISAATLGALDSIKDSLTSFKKKKKMLLKVIWKHQSYEKKSFAFTFLV